MLGYFANRYAKQHIYHQFMLPLSILMFVILVPHFLFNHSSVLLQLSITIAASTMLLNVSRIISEHFSKSSVNIILTYLGTITLQLYATHGFFTRIFCFGAIREVSLLSPLWQLLSALFISAIIIIVTVAISETLKKNRYLGLFLYGKTIYK